MTTLLTSRLPSAQVPVRPSGACASARGGEGTSAAAGGFDAVVVGYEAASKPPQAQRDPAPSKQKLGADPHGTTVASDQVAKTDLTWKRTRADALRRHPTSPTVDETSASPATVNAAGLSASEVASSSAKAAPAGPAVVPVCAGSLAPDTASDAIAAPVPASNLPGAAPEAAESPREASTMIGSNLPEATKIGPFAPGQSVIVASTSAQPQGDAKGGAAAGSPTATDPQIKNGDGSTDLGVLPAHASAGPQTSATASGTPVVAPGPGGSEAEASGTTADADTTHGGHAGQESNKGASVSLGQPVVNAPAGPTLQGPADVTAVVPGTPAAPVLGVVPAISSPVPPPIPWTVSGPSVAAQTTPFAPPAATQEQVFAAVSPLLRGADGSYGIHLQLHPRDLGAVQVTVDIHHGEISIQMNAPDAAARDALRGGLSDLRQQLESQGLRPGSMEVGSGGTNGRQPGTSWPTSEDNNVPRRGLVPADLHVASGVPASTTSLDLRI